MSDVRVALADDHPLGLLALASSLLAVVDPRRRNPFERPSGVDQESQSAEALLTSFLEVDRAETSALLAAIAALIDDELTQARIRRALASRAHRLPDWLSRLDETTADRAVEMVHVLGDGDDVFVAVHLPGGHDMTVVAYIDHNLGTVMKDAFVIDQAMDQVLTVMREKVDDPDTTFSDLDPADARARITDAIDSGARTFPRFETDSWPACRPLVEWAVRLLPPGGAAYQRPEWDDERLAGLADDFWASPFAQDLDDPDYRSLLGDVLWFGSGYGPGDPLRWSPVAVELLLADWIPRKIVADVNYLTKAPTLLRAFILYCHHQRRISPALTKDTLAAVDRWEPDYQETIRSPRLQGPEALLAAVGAFDPDGDWDLSDEPGDWQEVMLDSLRRAVGGGAVLDTLDDRPLPDEEFAWTQVPDSISSEVAQVLNLCDRCCDELLDIEYRTACRRLLACVATGKPEVFARRARPENSAAAICWIIGKANDLFSHTGGRMFVKDLMAHFGLVQGGASQRASTFLRAGGFDPDQYGGMDLGSPEFLVSTRRRRIIERRDDYRRTQQS